MEIVFIVNSLSLKAKRTKKELERLQSKHPDIVLKIMMTRSAGDAFKFATMAMKRRIDAIICCGGDGTLNEVLNGITDSDFQHDVALGQYPIGSANDLARTAGSFSLSTIIDKVVKKDFRRVDCSFLRRGGFTRRFINESTAGLGALVCLEVESTERRIPPRLRYSLASLNWVKRFQRPTIKIEMDEQTIETKVILMVVGKGNFVGFGLGFTPQSALDDGQFGVTIVEHGTIGILLKFGWKILRKKKIDHPWISYHKSSKVKVMVTEGRLPVETDGEYFDVLHAGEGVEYEIQKEKIKWI